MAEVTRRRQGEILRGIFQVLLDHPDGLPAREVLVRAEQVVPPTPFEDQTYPNNPDTRRYPKLARFTTINAVKAGWLLKDKGIWRLTDEGAKAFEDHLDAEDFLKTAAALYQAWKKSQPEPEPGVGEPIDDSDVASAGTLEEAEEAAWDEVSSYLQKMDPYRLQDLVAALLKAMGYHINWNAPPGPDRGIDVLAYTDPLGASGPRIKVQVKRRQDRIPVDGVRSFMAVLGDQDIGIFIATGGFTAEAEREARSQEKRRVTLLDDRLLFELWVEHYPKINEESRRLMPLRPVYFLEQPT